MKTHKHRCKCGTIWEHDDDCGVGNCKFDVAHKCPACGKVETLKFWGDEQPTHRNRTCDAVATPLKPGEKPLTKSPAEAFSDTINATLKDPVKLAGMMAGILKDMRFLAGIPTVALEQALATDEQLAGRESKAMEELAKVMPGRAGERLVELRTAGDEIRCESRNAIRALIEVKPVLERALDAYGIKYKLEHLG